MPSRAPEAPAVASLTARLTYGELADAGSRPRRPPRRRRGSAPAAASSSRSPTRRPRSSRASPLNALGATSVEVSREWSADVLGEIVDAGAGSARRSSGRATPAPGARRWPGRPIDHVWAVHPGRAPGRACATRSAASRRRLLREDGRRRPGPGRRPGAARARALRPDWPGAGPVHLRAAPGRPHGVVQTFRNIDANTRSIVEYLGLTAADRALVTLPLYYCYGRSVLQTHLFAGGSLVPRQPHGLPAPCHGDACRGGLHRVRRRPAHVRDDPPAGGRLDDRLPAAALPHPGRRGDGAGHHRLGPRAPSGPPGSS